MPVHKVDFFRKDITPCFVNRSGTTGSPKGALLTHSALVHGAATMNRGLPQPPDEHHVALGFLPQPHVYERALERACVMRGACVAFYRGDLKFLREDILAVRPTILPCVPAMLERFAREIKGAVHRSSLVKRGLFALALRIQNHSMKNVCHKRELRRTLAHAAEPGLLLAVCGTYFPTNSRYVRWSFAVHPLWICASFSLCPLFSRSRAGRVRDRGVRLDRVRDSCADSAMALVPTATRGPRPGWSAVSTLLGARSRD